MKKFAILTVLIIGYTPAGAACASDGKTLYEENCAACHGPTAEGGDDSEPDIRGTGRAALERSLAGMNRMPEFDLTADDITALHRYLYALSP